MGPKIIHLEAVDMARKKVRIVICENTLKEALEEAKRWVEQLKKDAKEERRTIRTRGLILLGAALLGETADEEKFDIYEKIIEIDSLLKNPKVKPEEKNFLKNKASKIAISLARKQQEKLKQEASVVQSEAPASASDGE